MTTAREFTGAPPWTANDGTFGARLALIRQRMEWGNVKEAAVACGIPVESWRAWERDGVLPRRYFEICEQIARVTNCDYGWLVDRRPSASSEPTPPKVTRKLRAIQGEGREPQPRTPLLVSLNPRLPDDGHA